MAPFFFVPPDYHQTKISRALLHHLGNGYGRGGPSAFKLHADELIMPVPPCHLRLVLSRLLNAPHPRDLCLTVFGHDFDLVCIFCYDAVNPRFPLEPFPRI